MAIFVVEVGGTTMTDLHDQEGMVAGGRTGRGVTGKEMEGEKGEFCVWEAISVISILTL